MMQLTTKDMQALLQCSDLNAANHLAAANQTLQLFGLGTAPRVAAVMATVGTETLGLRYMREIWGPTPAQRRYDAGQDIGIKLGNTKPGDGLRYLGRSPVMLTGRANYARARDSLREKFPSLGVPDFEESPELVASPTWGWMVLGDYFTTRGCVAPADRKDIDAVSRLVNGGTNGLDDRRRRYAICRKYLGI